MDTKSYYLDGQEVYREIDTNGNQIPDQFRWFGAGGMRWGVDVNQDGTIDGWQQISAEEVSQEVLRAVATKNLARLQALVLSDRELKSLELSPAEATRIRDSIAKIPAQFQATCTKLSKLNETVTLAAPRNAAAAVRSRRIDRRQVRSRPLPVGHHPLPDGRQGSRLAPDRRDDPGRPGVADGQRADPGPRRGPVDGQRRRRYRARSTSPTKPSRA